MRLTNTVLYNHLCQALTATDALQLLRLIVKAEKERAAIARKSFSVSKGFKLDLNEELPSAFNWAVFERVYNENTVYTFGYFSDLCFICDCKLKRSLSGNISVRNI